jgi:hypothetical protein
MNMREIPSATTSGHLRAGVAKSDITIDAPGVEVKDRLFSKALVLDDGTTRLAIITIDVTAIGGRHISRNMLPDVGEEFLPRLREKIHTELGIPGANVMVNASHTHPPGRMLCDDEEQIERTFDAASRASASMVEVKVGAGVGHESRITMNRNLKLKNGKHWTIRHTNPSPPSEEVVDIGPHDPQIGILRVDRIDGRPLAAVYNFASHLLFADPRGRVTADYVGKTSQIVEGTLGDGAMAFFLQGAAGDVIDVFFKDFSRVRDVEPLGLMLAESTLKAFREVLTAAGGLKVISKIIQLPRRTDIPERIAALQEEQAVLLESLRSTTLNFESFLPLYLKHQLNPTPASDFSFRFLQEGSISPDDLAAMNTVAQRNVDKYLQNLKAMEILARIRDDISTLQKHKALNDESGESTIRAEVQGIRIGEFVLITAPIEVLTEVSLNIKRGSPHKYTFIAGFSNGYMHYGPPAEDYDKGGYEVNECLLAPEWQAMFERTARQILASL